jgi:peptidoglycan/xylan/chitin deacetylase (PgdA/CDA1 family)
MLKRIKAGILRLSEMTGMSRLLSGTAWRRHRLLILCYHGVSMSDEHEWGSLYISSQTLRRRMELLAHAGCNVLSLTEGLQRLNKGTLPDRSVVITFDDGMHDFFELSFPIIESFGYPVTLYLTTYYVEFNRPVFDPMCSYLLWKGRHKRLLDWPEIFPSPLALDDAGRRHAMEAIRQFAFTRKLSGQSKDDLLGSLAQHLEIDYQELCRKRVMHLITQEEARQLVARGVDLQYHTHRHRVYRSRERMFAELQDNRRQIVSLSHIEPRHFCYTGGFYLPDHPGYLKEYGMLSATTCHSGLCTAQSNPFLLPRLVDTETLSDLEFRAWLSGTAQLLPQRRYEANEDQLGQEEILAAGSM